MVRRGRPRADHCVTNTLTTQVILWTLSEKSAQQNEWINYMDKLKNVWTVWCVCWTCRVTSSHEFHVLVNYYYNITSNVFVWMYSAYLQYQSLRAWENPQTNRPNFAGRIMALAFILMCVSFFIPVFVISSKINSTYNKVSAISDNNRSRIVHFLHVLHQVMIHLSKRVNS